MADREHESDELVAYAVGKSSESDIVPAERSRDWMVKTTSSFANRCLPLLMANESGWWLRNRDAFTATWNGGRHRGDVEISFDAEVPPNPQVTSQFGHGILTWGTAFVFRTPPGIDLLVRGPANLPKDGVTALEGLVEADWIEVPFTMNWKLTRPGLAVRFEQAEPFAMVVPQIRRDLERYRPIVRPLGDAPVLIESVRQWTARGHRQELRRFVAEHVPIGGPEWNGSYLRGETRDGARFDDHRVRRELQRFTRSDSTSSE